MRSDSDSTSTEFTALPGAPGFKPELLRELRQAWSARLGHDQPRTRHLAPGGKPKYLNRLFLESSPYLRQHAHNPVDWRPWGEEAFRAAKELNRPVLLSVGYSTCHWCHVMEEESFEDEEIARRLNESYIAVKIDREERPDIDALYLSAVEAMTGRGGWPLTIWLTPDRKPFFGGTYFPPRDGARGFSVGFLTLLVRIEELWRTERDRIEESAAQLARVLERPAYRPPSRVQLPDSSVLKKAAEYYLSRFDKEQGGLAGTLKFPSSLPVRFLLREQRRTGYARLLEMAALTLGKMAGGGIHDQIGGGFHRYSIDSRWLVPHFEKMLYDNAQLALAFLEGYQATGRAEFAQVAREVLAYVQREMTSPEGAFYSATDADSLAPSGRLEEGRFFTWTVEEIERALGSEAAHIVCAYFGVTRAGNFADGRSVLSASRPLVDVAAEVGESPKRLRAIIDSSKPRLYAARDRRPRPSRDEKVLAAWNGLMISAFARAALVLVEPAFASQAARAARFLLERMRRNGRLLRMNAEGSAGRDGYLEDYAFVIAGLIELFEATGEASWLHAAIDLDTILKEHFEDPNEGGFYITGDDQEPLLARQKPSFDGAEPSGNSVHALNLLRLFELTSRESYRERAERTIASFSEILLEAPEALSEMLLALDFALGHPKQIALVAREALVEAEPFLAELRKRFLPDRVLVLETEGPQLEKAAQVVPWISDKVARDGRPTAYVCERGSCRLPTNAPAAFADQLEQGRSIS